MATSPALSSTVKAGRLLLLLGWLTLAFALLVGAAILILPIHAGVSLSGDALIAMFGALAMSVLYLVTGSGVKKYRSWARLVAAIISILSLANVPVGTILGGITFFYLLKGWRETGDA